MNNLCNDLSQQIQFLQRKQKHEHLSTTTDSKIIKSSVDFKVTSIRSIRSIASQNHGYTSSNGYVEFDIFNDLLSSPKKYNKSAVTTPNNWNYNYYQQQPTNYNIMQSPSNLTSKKQRSYSQELQIMDNFENKDELIDLLRNDLNELQIKYDRDMIQSRIDLEKELRMELETEIRTRLEDELVFNLKQQRSSLMEYGENDGNDGSDGKEENEDKNVNVDVVMKKKKVKSKRGIGTQTKVLGFWERLFTEIRCIPIDENEEF